MTPHPIPHPAGGYALVLPALQNRFADWDAWLAGAPADRIVDKPTRTVLRVTDPQGVFYVKTVRTLADGRHRFLDAFKRLKWRLVPSRAFRTFRVMDAMRTAGIRCPEPVFALHRRTRLLASPEDILVTRELRAPSLSDVLRDTAPEDRPELLRRVLPDILTFHLNGFIHGDFIPGNMLWDGDRLAFIDHDRTRRTDRPDPAARDRNLLQFCYHLALETETLALVPLVLDSYTDLARRTPRTPLPDLPKLRIAILARLRRKIRKCRLEDWLTPQLGQYTR